MLSNLVYVSLRTPQCTEPEIEKILASCKKNNPKYDITGVLLYSSTHFVQYIEGENEEIVSLYDRIKADTRHKNAIMISLSPINGRIFPSWQMGSKKINDNYDFLTELSASEKLTFKAILNGEGQEGNKALEMMKKFFK